MIRDLIHGLQNLWAWLPVIWKDRDWDYHFLLRLIEFKLEKMARHFLEHNLIMDAEKIAAEARRAAYLAHAISEGQIEDRYFDAWREAWWAWEWVRTPLPRNLTGYSVAEQDKPSVEAMTRAGQAGDLAQHAAMIELCQTLMLMERWWD